MSEVINPYKAGADLRFLVDNSFTDERGVFHRLRRRGFTTEKEARAWSRRAELLAREGVQQERRRRPAGELVEHPETWTTDQVWSRVLGLIRDRLKETTVRHLESAYRVHVAHVVGVKVFCQLSQRDFDRLAGNGYAVQVWRSLLKYAARVGATMPAARFDPPRRKVSQRLVWLEPDEARRACDLLPEEYRPIFLVSLGLGLRLGEACGLKWGDIDLRRGLVTVSRQLSIYGKLTTTKSGKVRVVPLSATARRGLDLLPRGGGDDLLFPNQRQKFAKALLQIRPDLGKEITSHVLRHSNATWQVIAGVPLAVVGKMLGHSSAQVTELYSHLQPAHLIDGTTAVDAAFSC